MELEIGWRLLVALLALALAWPNKERLTVVYRKPRDAPWPEEED